MKKFVRYFLPGVILTFSTFDAFGAYKTPKVNVGKTSTIIKTTSDFEIEIGQAFDNQENLNTIEQEIEKAVKNSEITVANRNNLINKLGFEVYFSPKKKSDYKEEIQQTLKDFNSHKLSQNQYFAELKRIEKEIDYSTTLSDENKRKLFNKMGISHEPKKQPSLSSSSSSSSFQQASPKALSPKPTSAQIALKKKFAEEIDGILDQIRLGNFRNFSDSKGGTIDSQQGLSESEGGAILAEIMERVNRSNLSAQDKKELEDNTFCRYE